MALPVPWQAMCGDFSTESAGFFPYFPVTATRIACHPAIPQVASPDGRPPMLQKTLDHYLSRPALSLPALDESARQNLASAQRSLQGLAAVLDVLEADHLVYKVGPSEPPPAPRLVDGLLMAGRQLIASAQAALERP
jgi:hypothetical protein